MTKPSRIFWETAAAHGSCLAFVVESAHSFQVIKLVTERDTLLQRICYSHWANWAQNGVISIGQWGVFNHEKGAI